MTPSLDTLSTVKYRVDDGIAIITLYRPTALNAFNITMAFELSFLFREAINKDDKVRAVIITGEGKAFCAGADLSDGAFSFSDTSTEELSRNTFGLSASSTYRDVGGILTLSILACRKPIIAAINGSAVGIGITMTLPMDVRIVSETARVGFVFSRRGIVPEACSSWILPRIVGTTKASEWLLTGRVFVASQEANSGLFNYVVKPDQVFSKAMEIAKEMSIHCSPMSLALTKALIWKGLSAPDPETAHLAESKCLHWVGQQKDCAEGVMSFLEKRPPKFSMSVWNDLPEFYPWWNEQLQKSLLTARL